MTDKHIQAEAPHSNMEKDPSDWVTGDEPMTGAQKSYLKTLSEEAGAEFDESLTKAAASEEIDALQQKTGRGADHGARHSGAASHGDADAKAKASVDDSDASSTRRSSKADGTDKQGDQAEGDLFEAAGGVQRSSNSR